MWQCATIYIILNNLNFSRIFLLYMLLEYLEIKIIYKKNKNIIQNFHNISMYVIQKSQLSI